MSAAESTSNSALRPIGLVKASRPEKPAPSLPAQPPPIAPKPTRSLDKREALFRVVIVLVIGFALGAHAAIVQTQGLALRMAIVLGSVCVWILCVYLVMIYWLNNFGS